MDNRVVQIPAWTGAPAADQLRMSELSSRQSSPAERLAFVDSLRGLAAIYVLMFHQITVPQPMVAPPDWASSFLLHGSSGVTLFFIVSAFSLCHAHSQGFSASGDRRAFFVRRAARVLPLFYVMLAVTLVRSWTVVHWPISFGQVCRAVFLVFNLVPGDEGGIVPGAWTIGTEVVFYAIFPFIFGRLRNLFGIAAAALAALLAGVVFQEIVLNLPYAQPVLSSFWSCSFPRHLPVFLLGMATWMVFDRFIRGGKHAPARGAVLILGSLWTYHAYLHGSLNVLFPDTYYWQALIFAALVLGLAMLPTRVIVNRVTLFCGRISYSIYLLQGTIIFNLSWFYRAASRWHCSANVSYFACLAVTSACVIPLAMLSYRYIERPGMRFGNRVISRFAPA